MKKFLSFLLSIAIVFSFASCDTVSDDTDPIESIPSDTFSSDTDSTTTEHHIPQLPTKSNGTYYPMTTTFSDTSTRLLFTTGGVVRYYNKFTEEIYPFCFDPLCKHDGYDCISYKFEMTDTGRQTIRFCEYDNRFYALRGEQFCSFSFDGSDLKVVQSFGMDGNFETEMKGYLYGGLTYLQIHGKNVYFIARDNESGKRGLMCYDAETKEMNRVFYDENTAVYGYLLSANGIYITLTGVYQGLYYISYEGGTPRLIAEDIYDSFAEGIFDDECFYFIKTTPLYDEEKKYTRYLPDKIVAFIPETAAFEDIMEIDIQNEHHLLAITDEYIYYTVNEPISIGYSESPRMTSEVFNEYSKIYRYHRERGEVAVVLNDLRCETKMLYFIEDKVLILGHVCTPSEDHAFRTLGGFIASLDENGMFTELTRMED